MHKKEGASRAFVVTMCSLVDNPRSLNLKEGRSPHSPNDSLVTKQNCAFATNSFFTEKKKYSSLFLLVASHRSFFLFSTNCLPLLFYCCCCSLLRACATFISIHKLITTSHFVDFQSLFFTNSAFPSTITFYFRTSSGLPSSWVRSTAPSPVRARSRTRPPRSPSRRSRNSLVAAR